MHSLSRIIQRENSLPVLMENFTKNTHEYLSQKSDSDPVKQKYIFILKLAEQRPVLGTNQEKNVTCILFSSICTFMEIVLYITQDII